ncbi:MAG TPA: class I SAM-dependent methyltransferase [Candidatus Kryptonia bacterium]|nr:class I SAM-dependent methyltransferase [Candidatus Kryptonia bacterium]
MPTLEQAQAHESKIYYEFSHLYDRIFTRVFYPRIARVIRDLDIPPGARVLEVGVGTGLSFPAYPPHCQVTGIDLAPEMLEQAKEKIVRNGWRHITVQAMDALDLKFPEDSFDYVMAFHVVSVVPDTLRLMREAQRVCRPGGTVVVINHFRSPHRLLAALDRSIEPITRRLGWRTLNMEDVFDGLPMVRRRQYKTSPRSLFTIVLAENRK